jgi:regulator of protease activity HflC (stomatin/prohibitin superfamily)
MAYTYAQQQKQAFQERLKAEQEMIRKRQIEAQLEKEEREAANLAARNAYLAQLEAERTRREQVRQAEIDKMLAPHLKAYRTKWQLEHPESDWTPAVEKMAKSVLLDDFNKSAYEESRQRFVQARGPIF